MIWKYSLADFDKACDAIQNVDWDALMNDKDIDKA